MVKSAPPVEVAKGDAYSAALAMVDTDVSWSPLPIEWKNVDPFSEAGLAPLTVTTPTVAYAYGAVSHPLASPVIATPTILRIDVAEAKGLVGVSLVNPLGKPLVSQEQKVSSEDGERSIFIEVRPKDLPAAILVRNYGDTSGSQGSLKVKGVSYVPVTALSEAQMAALQQVGLNKPLLP